MSPAKHRAFVAFVARVAALQIGDDCDADADQLEALVAEAHALHKPQPNITLTITPRQLATLQAALVFWERVGVNAIDPRTGEENAEQTIASGESEFDVMSETEIKAWLVGLWPDLLIE